MSSTDILLAGAIAAFSIDLVIYPIDTLKTRLQSPVHRNRVQFRGLYQGVGSVVLATLPASSIFFTTYETIRAHLPASPLTNVIASGTAELASCAVLCPAEVIKQNAQVISASKKSRGLGASMEAFRRIPRTRDLWKGYTTLAARNIPFTAMQFPVFEALKMRLLKRYGGENVSPVKTIGLAGIAAGTSGCFAAILTTPIDVIKTRIMLAAGDGTAKKRRIKEVVNEVVQTEGWKGLWRGGALRGVYTAFGMGLYLGVYEGCKVYFKRKREKGKMVI